MSEKLEWYCKLCGGYFEGFRDAKKCPTCSSDAIVVSPFYLEIKKGKYSILYYGGHSDLPLKSPAPALVELSITPKELQFKCVSREYAGNSFSIPLEKIRRVDIKKTKEITGWRMFLLGPLFATILKEKKYFIRLAYEDEIDLMQDLLFDTAIGDDESLSLKIGIIKNIRSAIKVLKKG